MKNQLDIDNEKPQRSLEDLDAAMDELEKRLDTRDYLEELEAEWTEFCRSGMD